MKQVLVFALCCFLISFTGAHNDNSYNNNNNNNANAQTDDAHLKTLLPMAMMISLRHNAYRMMMRNPMLALSVASPAGMWNPFMAAFTAPQAFMTAPAGFLPQPGNGFGGGLMNRYGYGGSTNVNSINNLQLWNGFNPLNLNSNGFYYGPSLFGSPAYGTQYIREPTGYAFANTFPQGLDSRSGYKESDAVFAQMQQTSNTAYQQQQQQQQFGALPTKQAPEELDAASQIEQLI